MKIVVNVCYGGFDICTLPIDIQNELGESSTQMFFSNYERVRTNPHVIEWVEAHPYVKNDCTELGVIDIPDGATDYRIIENDGYEHIMYVLNGKIEEIWAPVEEEVEAEEDEDEEEDG